MRFKPKILVTSAGGKTGQLVVRELLKRGYPVRALLHRSDARSDALRKAGAEVRVGDQSNPTVLQSAMEGVQRAYHCPPTAANALYFTTAFAAAAQAVRLEHVVTLSQWLASPNHPSLLTREIWLGLQTLKSLPDTALTEVNVGWFADNYFMVTPFIAQLGQLTMPLGDGSVKKNAPPANEDIAAVVVEALIDPDRHAGQTYRPTGPELLSPDEIAGEMAQALGRKVIYKDLPPAMLLKALVALKPANYSEFMLTQLPIYCDEYRRGAFAVNAPNDTVERIIGRPAESFRSLAKRSFAARADAHQSWSNRLAALGAFLKIGMTPTPDLQAIERRRDHVLPAAPLFCRDDATWRESHTETPTPQRVEAAE